MRTDRTTATADAARRGPRRRGPAARGLVLLALAVGMLGAVAGPASAAAQPGSSAAGAAGTTTTAAVKRAPAPPQGVAVGKENVAKPHVKTDGTIRPMTPWSVSLAASSTSLWPTQYTTLTATASADVGPTIYYIYIYDADTGVDLAKCGTGTTCSVAVTEPTPAWGDFYAFISDGSDTYGAREIAIASGPSVVWKSLGLTLGASQYTLPVGNSSTLTTTESEDIGPSPFYVQIWDTTANTLLAQCGSGTTCSATVSQSTATTHTYVATFGAFASTNPPPELQTTSPVTYVTWTASGYVLSLSAPAVTYNGPETVTASANVDVGPTPYYIEIFNENGTLLDTCGSGTTCSFSYTPAAYPGSNLVALIASSSSTLPPANIQASSNTVSTYYVPPPS